MHLQTPTLLLAILALKGFCQTPPTSANADSARSEPTISIAAAKSTSTTIKGQYTSSLVADSSTLAAVTTAAATTSSIPRFPDRPGFLFNNSNSPTKDHTTHLHTNQSVSFTAVGNDTSRNNTDEKGVASAAGAAAAVAALSAANKSEGKHVGSDGRAGELGIFVLACAGLLFLV